MRHIVWLTIIFVFMLAPSGLTANTTVSFSLVILPTVVDEIHTVPNTLSDHDGSTNSLEPDGTALGEMERSTALSSLLQQQQLSGEESQSVEDSSHHESLLTPLVVDQHRVDTTIRAGPIVN